MIRFESQSIFTRQSIAEFLSLGVLAMLLAFSLSTAAIAAPPQGLNPAAFQPAKLRYAASKFFLSAETQIIQELISASQAAKELIAVPNNDGLKPSENKVIKQTILMNAFGLNSKIQAWLNPDASILQRTSFSSGRKNRLRTYRYTSEGAYSMRRYPKGAQEKEQPASQWSNVREDFYPLPISLRTTRLSEAEALLYLVSVAELKKPGDNLVLPVFEDEQLINVSIAVLDRPSLTVDFKIASADGEKRVSERLEVIRARISARPATPQSNLDEFDFLGYKGDVDLFIDPKRRIIVQMSGVFDYVGDVDIRLQEVDYR